MKVETEKWKHYTLKTGGGRSMAYLSHAQVLGVGPVAQAEAKETDDARDMLLQKLGELESQRVLDGSRNLVIPSTAEFLCAIAALDVSSSVQSMMRALALTDENGITATELANVAGYSAYNAANLHLGKAAAQIAHMLGLRTDQILDAEGRPAATFLIADEGPIDEATGNWTWIPRPSFALAFNRVQGTSHG